MPDKALVRNALAVAFGAGFILSLVFVFFLTSVKSANFEQLLFSRLPYEERVTGEERLSVRSAVRDFLNGNAELSGQLFSEREIYHMHDVKRLIDIAFLAGLLSLSLLFASAAVLREPRRLLRALLASSLAGLAVLTGVFVGFVLFFDRFFYWFHTVSFANDLWLLDPSRHALIRAYPEDFFQLFAQYDSVAVVIALCVTGALCGFALRRQTQ